MSSMYYLVSDKTKEYFDLNKFSVGPHQEWNRVFTAPEQLAFDIHKSWLDQSNENFPYSWCLALLKHIEKVMTITDDLYIFNISHDEEAVRIESEYTLVGDRFDSFEGNV